MADGHAQVLAVTHDVEPLEGASGILGAEQEPAHAACLIRQELHRGAREPLRVGVLLQSPLVLRVGQQQVHRVVEQEAAGMAVGQLVQATTAEPPDARQDGVLDALDRARCHRCAPPRTTGCPRRGPGCPR